MATKEAEKSPSEIGEACAAVVAGFAKPNINARTMMSMPEFWAGIVKALRGEEAAPPVEPVVPAEEAGEENGDDNGDEEGEVKTRSRRTRRG